MARSRLEFDGLDELIVKLETISRGASGDATDKALKATHEYITSKIHEDMKKHNKTGRTESSIRDSVKISWAGDVAEVPIGFDIGNGGLASIFLMYGTPRTKKDQKLYNDIYGKKTVQEIRDLQQKIFYEELRKLGD